MRKNELTRDLEVDLSLKLERPAWGCSFPPSAPPSWVRTHLKQQLQTLPLHQIDGLTCQLVLTEEELEEGEGLSCELDIKLSGLVLAQQQRPIKFAVAGHWTGNEAHATALKKTRRITVENKWVTVEDCEVQRSIVTAFAAMARKEIKELMSTLVQEIVVQCAVVEQLYNLVDALNFFEAAQPAPWTLIRKNAASEYAQYRIEIRRGTNCLLALSPAFCNRWEADSDLDSDLIRTLPGSVFLQEALGQAFGALAQASTTETIFTHLEHLLQTIAGFQDQALHC